MSLSIGASTSTGGVNGVSGDVSSAAISTSAGSLLVAFISASVTAFTSFSDSAGLTWTERGTPTNANTGSSNHETRTFTAPNPSAVGSHVFTMAKSAGSYWSIRVIEIISNTGTPEYDAIASLLNSNVSPLSSGNLTTTQSGDMIIGWGVALYYGASVSFTWNNSETPIIESTVANSTPYYYGDSVAYRTAGAAGTYAETATHDQGNYGVMWALAIKESAAAASPSGTRLCAAKR